MQIGEFFSHVIETMKTIETRMRYFLHGLQQRMYPIGSMYATYGNMYHQYTPNVSIYTVIYHTWILWVIRNHGLIIGHQVFQPAMALQVNSVEAIIDDEPLGCINMGTNCIECYRCIEKNEKNNM